MCVMTYAHRLRALTPHQPRPLANRRHKRRHADFPAASPRPRGT